MGKEEGGKDLYFGCCCCCWLLLLLSLLFTPPQLKDEDFGPSLLFVISSSPRLLVDETRCVKGSVLVMYWSAEKMKERLWFKLPPEEWAIFLGIKMKTRKRIESFLLKRCEAQFISGYNSVFWEASSKEFWLWKLNEIFWSKLVWFDWLLAAEYICYQQLFWQFCVFVFHFFFFFLGKKYHLDFDIMSPFSQQITYHQMVKMLDIWFDSSCWQVLDEDSN